MKYLVSAICSGIVGVSIGIALSHGNLTLAKKYNLEADRTMVDASRLYFEAAEYYTESADLFDEAVSVCYGRVEL